MPLLMVDHDVVQRGGLVHDAEGKPSVEPDKQGNKDACDGPGYAL